MSEDPPMQSQPSSQSPSSSQLPPAPAPDPRGSLAVGIGLFFASAVGGSIVAGLLLSVLLQWSGGGPLLMLSSLLPWAAPLALGLWLAAKGRSRTALGMLLGFGILVALVLLLVAACFGIMAVGN